VRQRLKNVRPEALAAVRAALAQGRLLPAREVLVLARQARPGLGRATVYRALAWLNLSGEVGIIRSKKGSLYHLCARTHTHHMVCRSCLAATEIPPDHLDGLEMALERAGARAAQMTGFRVEDHTLEFTGLCASCGGKA
jgi:Fur family ferric uptake transcriptional regulator